MTRLAFARIIRDAISADGRDRSEKGARRTAEPRRTVRTSQARGAPYDLRSERIGTSEWSRRELSGLTGALLAVLGGAPLQCRRDPSPELRTEDSAGDALWGLAQNFRAKGNEQAARETMRFLVERYPSNRFAPAARAELEGRDASPPGK